MNETKFDRSHDAPQELNLIRFQRLQAEVDLLKLKAEVEKAGK